MDERDMERCLYELLCSIDAEALAEAGLDTPDGIDAIEGVRTYQDVGMLTNNAGLVVRMEDGSEFQITIVQIR